VQKFDEHPFGCFDYHSEHMQENQDRYVQPPGVPNTADLSALCQLFAGAAEASTSFHARAKHLLDGACKLINAQLVSFGIVHDALPGQTLRVEFLGMFGDWRGGDCRQTFITYLQEGLASDPAYPMAVERLLAARPGEPLALSRPDLINNDEWYASPHVQTLRLAAGLDDALYCAIGMPHPPGQFRAMTFVRKASAGPFSPRDQHLARLLISSLDWLFIGLDREREATRITDSLNASLWGTLACLQAGDSVKEAAKKLGCTPLTISTYVKRLHRHFGVSSRGELLVRCAELRISASVADTRWARSFKASLDLPARDAQNDTPPAETPPAT